MDPVIGSAIIGAASSGLASMTNANLNRKNRDWNEKLMRESWLRDDNAVQRRAVDMKAAGVNPLLAAGSAAVPSHPVSNQAPQVGDFGAAAISGAMAAQQRKQENRMFKLQEDINEKQLENLAASTNVSRVEFMQKMNDFIINVRRDTRSNDQRSQLDQLVTEMGNWGEGDFDQDFSKFWNKIRTFLPSGIKKKGDSLLGSITPEDSWRDPVKMQQQAEKDKPKPKLDGRGNPIGM